MAALQFSRLLGHPKPPRQLSDESIDQMKAACVSRNFEQFHEILSDLSPDSFGIHDLVPVMSEAVKHNFSEVVSELMRRGLPMHYTYVLEAIQHRSKDVLGVFLQNGWNINEPISELDPPALAYAIEDEQMTIWLLDHGADPNQQCSIDITPMSYAVERGPLRILQLLLDRGGDVRIGELCQHAIGRHTDVLEVLDLLLERGAPLNLTMYQNHYASWRLYFFMGLGTPLHKAVEAGMVEVVRHLISKGADTRIKDAKDRTALDCAKEFGFSEIVELLQDKET